MNVTITYLGNSATLSGLLSVQRIQEETFFLFVLLAEDDLPDAWQDNIRDNNTLVFPTAAIKFTVTE